MSFRWITVFLGFPAGSFGAGTAFWRRVTGYGLSPFRGADGEFAALAGPAGRAHCLVNRPQVTGPGYATSRRAVAATATAAKTAV